MTRPPEAWKAAAARRTFPSVPDLVRLPAGDRAPRLRALIAFHAARIEGAGPAVQAQHRTIIRKVIEVGRLAGIAEPQLP